MVIDLDPMHFISVIINCYASLVLLIQQNNFTSNKQLFVIL